MENQKIENEVSIWEKIKAERGGIAQIHEVFHDYLDGVEAHYDFYKRVVISQDNEQTLSRLEREYLAYKVSEYNQCPYCYKHHKSAFENIEVISNQKIEPQKLELLDQLAQSLTLSPWKTAQLKKRFMSIFSEVKWKHAVMVAGYFNMANRLAFAMDIELEENFTQTCS